MAIRSIVIMSCSSYIDNIGLCGGTLCVPFQTKCPHCLSTPTPPSQSSTPTPPPPFPHLLVPIPTYVSAHLIYPDPFNIHHLKYSYIPRANPRLSAIIIPGHILSADIPIPLWMYLEPPSYLNLLAERACY